MTNQSSFIRAAILADDVRTEINGKHIIVGTYNSDINVPQFPVVLKFRVVLILAFNEQRSRNLEIRIVGPSGDEFAKFTADVEIEQPKTTQVLPLFGFAMPFSSEGSFKIESHEGDEWVPLGSWQIKRAEHPFEQFAN
jgi:hypothetical protein